MNKSELIMIAKDILSESKTAVLSTVTSDREPRMRWMSPVFLRNFEDCIYAVTSSTFSKAQDIKKNNKVQWLLQTRGLNRIITLNGEINIVDDLSLRTEVLESLGSRLHTFWKINEDPSSLIVFETKISSGILFSPVSGQKNYVSFDEGD